MGGGGGGGILIMGGGLEKSIKSNKQGGGRDKRGVGFLLFLQTKFGDLLQNLLEGKIVENKKTKFSYAKQIFFAFFRNSNEYEHCQMFLTFLKIY